MDNMYIYYKKLHCRSSKKSKKRKRDNSESELEAIIENRTVHRHHAKPPSWRRKQEQLEDEKKKKLRKAKPEEKKAIRKEFNKEIKDISKLKNGYEVPILEYIKTKKFMDLNGNPIGLAYVSESNKRKDILIGNTEFIKYISFDYSATESGESLIRTVAYLTDKGINGLKTYLRNKGKQSYDKSKPVTNKKIKQNPVRNNNKNIKNRILTVKTYDMYISGHKVHVNLEGKLDIFTVNKYQNKLLDVKKASKKLGKKILNFARFGREKTWVRQTTGMNNQFIEETFVMLAEILYEIYKKHEIETVVDQAIKAESFPFANLGEPYEQQSQYQAPPL